MRQFPLAAPAVATLLALFGAAGCNAQSTNAHNAPRESTQDRAFGEKVHAYLLAHPEVIEEAVQKLQANEDAVKRANAQLAIASNRQVLEHDPRDGVAGNPAGAVTVVEFFDYRCPYCKAAEPELERLLARRHDVRLVLKEFPILDVEDQTHISEDASRAALGALAQGKYVQVHNALLAEKQLDEDGIKRILQANGVDFARDQTAAHSKAVTDQLADDHALARELGVDGTPAFMVGNRMVAGAQMDELEAAITAASKTK